MSGTNENILPAMPDAKQEVRVGQDQGETVSRTLARLTLEPLLTGASILKMVSSNQFANQNDLTDLAHELKKQCAEIHAGDLYNVESQLYTQGVTMAAWANEFSRRAMNNLNEGAEYTAAGERYFKLALKAQNQSRMTFETLAAVKNPPVVYAKQANINNGGQQQVNNHAHAQKTENQPSKVLEQSIEVPQRMDTRTQSQASQSDSAMEAVE